MFLITNGEKDQGNFDIPASLADIAVTVNLQIKNHQISRTIYNRTKNIGAGATYCPDSKANREK